MTQMHKFNFVIFIILFLGFNVTLSAQKVAGCEAAAGISGMYQINVDQSDKLYSVIESATSKIPYGEQQQFFMDLAVRLTPPDLLAIECRGNQILLGSSRARRISFKADGVTRKTRTSDGKPIETRILFERNSLVFTSRGGTTNDKLSFTFTPFDNGTKLRVKRQISAEELIEPVDIETVYNKVDEVARWNIYGERQITGRIPAPSKRTTEQIQEPIKQNSPSSNNEAAEISQLLKQWIEATNDRDIEKQMTFYMPELKAFYLSRNAPRSAVKLEKTRVFAKAKLIDIQAAEPEIIFQENGQTAVMRFRKKYKVVNQTKTQRGEVVQELRWRQTNNGWKIFSERDIKVLS